MSKYAGRYYNDDQEIRHVHWSGCWLLLFLWLAGALPEFILHIDTALNADTLWNEGLLLSVLFAIVPALGVFALVCLIPWRKVNIALTITYSAIYYVLCAAQLVYFNNFGTFFSAYSAIHGGAALQFWDVILTRITQNIHWLLIMALPLLFFSIFSWRVFAMNGTKKFWLGSIPAAAAVVVQIALVMALPLLGGTEQMSTYDLYHHTTDSYYCINKLGVLTGFRVDAQRLFAPEEPTGSVNIQITLPSFTLPTFPTTQPTDSTEPGATWPSIPEIPPIDTSPNILDIDFATLIENAKNNTIKTMHQYFQSKQASNKNAYTGIFEGCNLIMITAEAFAAEVIDPELTPTLYRLANSGIQFTD